MSISQILLVKVLTKKQQLKVHFKAQITTFLIPLTAPSASPFNLSKNKIHWNKYSLNNKWIF